MSPSWSPDGRWIAYLSDATGEYEIYVIAQDGSGSPRQVTFDGTVWRFPPVWSPDSDLMAFGDKKRRLWIVDVGTGDTTLVDTGKQGDLDGYTWSPDSRWLAYQTAHDSRLPGIAVYSLDDGKSRLLGDGLTVDFQPAFGTDGRYLFFLSFRDYPIRFSDFEFNFLYDGATRIYAAALDPSAPPLFPPKSDEERGEESSEGTTTCRWRKARSSTGTRPTARSSTSTATTSRNARTNRSSRGCSPSGSRPTARCSCTVRDRRGLSRSPSPSQMEKRVGSISPH
jgi:tricorn protease